MRKKKNNRFLAVLLALMLVVPAVLLSVSAYPAETYVPANQSVSLGGSGISASWSERYARLTRVNMVEGEPYVMTYGNIQLSFADATREWRYVSFEMHLVNYNVAMGHYTIGFVDTAEGLKVRLGRSAFKIGSTDYTAEFYPVKELVSPDAVTFLAGASLTELQNGQIVIDLQCYGLDANGVVVDTFIFTEIVPVYFDYMDFSAKTEYARLVHADIIDMTTPIPHMPSDLVAYSSLTHQATQDGYNEGYSVGDTEGYDRGYISGFGYGEQFGYEAGYIDGKHKAAHDAASSFDNMGRLIWTVIDMPFYLVQNVLNFDVFGMSIAGLVSGLLTIGLAVFVLKKVGII